MRHDAPPALSLPLARHLPCSVFARVPPRVPIRILAAAAATTLMMLVGYTSTHLGWDSLSDSVVVSERQLAEAAFLAFADEDDR